MADIGTLNKETYDAVSNIVSFLLNPAQKQWLSTRPRSEVALALLYVAEEVAVTEPQDVKEKVAMLAYEVADTLGSRIDDGEPR